MMKTCDRDVSIVVKICDCLDILTKEFKKVSTENCMKIDINQKSIIYVIVENAHLTCQRISTYSDLQVLVVNFIPLCHLQNCSNCDSLYFLQLCLVLLHLLQLSLKKEIPPNVNQQTNATTNLLSISQEKTVKKTFQFIVALGILPNLLPGIGVPLIKRIQHAGLLKSLSLAITPYQKHIILVACLKSLLNSLKCEAMQSIVVSYHGTDLLAVLLQLCYAPIKKIQESEIEPERNVEIENMEFPNLIVAVKDDFKHSDLEIVNLMHVHRTHFLCQLDKVCKRLSPALLMWELLLFQGIPIKKEDSEVEVAKVPSWLRKICNGMLTNMILQDQGIASFVQVVLDKAFDLDVQCGNVDSTRMQAVAQLISFKPLGNISISEYMQQLSPQVLRLLQSKDTGMDHILKYVASSIIFQFCERSMKVAESCFLDLLLKPMWKFVQKTDFDIQTVVYENELSSCIENLHMMFVTCSSPLSRKHIKIIFPFSNCLCSLHFFLLEGTSFLKSMVKSLLCAVFEGITTEDALLLLQTVTFPDRKRPTEVYSVQVKFCHGNEGGIFAVEKNSDDKNSVEVIPYKAILNILKELQNKDLCRSYILFTLKEFCIFRSEVEQRGEDSHNLEMGFLFSILLQELAEWDVDIGEILMTNVTEVIGLLMTMLEIISNEKSDSPFFEEIARMVLLILSSILENENQITAKEWLYLKSTLPSLKKLESSNIDPELKEMLFFVSVHISTQGVGGKSNSDVLKQLLASRYADSNSTSLSEQKTQIKDITSDELSSSSVSPSKKLSSTTKENQISNHSDEANSADTAKGVIKCSEFAAVMLDVQSESIPAKGHGLIALSKLIKNHDSETLENRKNVLDLLQENLEHEDSYVYLPSIRCLTRLADVDAKFVLPVILNAFVQNTENLEITLKLGEVLKQTCTLLGELIYCYKDQLLHAYLMKTKHEDAQIRASSLSNLGEVCMNLKFNLHTHLQEILSCVCSLLKTDEDLEVRRSAAMVLYLLLKGVGKNVLKICGDELKLIYKHLLNVYKHEDDEKLRLHSQLALEEINAIMADFFNPTISLTKEIKLL